MGDFIFQGVEDTLHMLRQAVPDRFAAPSPAMRKNSLLVIEDVDKAVRDICAI